jgi:diguanylate cyclase (GGDEF)-like protein/PAS domain S-box-containing protein
MSFWLKQVQMRRKSFGRIIISGVLLANVVAITLASVAIWNSHSRYKEQTTRNTQNFAYLLEHAFSQEIEKIDLGLATLADQGLDVIQDNPDDQEIINKIDYATAHKYKTLAEITIIDKNGNVIVNENKLALKKEWIDQYILNPQKNSIDNKLNISPVLTISDGVSVIAFSHKIVNKNGQFIGVVYKIIHSDELVTKFKKLNIGLHGTIVLRNEKSELISRFPNANFKKEISASKMLKDLIAQKKLSGTYMAITPVDQIERIYSLKKIKNYPLYILIGIATDDYLSSWYTEVTKIASIVVIFGIFSLASTKYVLNSWNKIRENDQKLNLILNSAGEAIYGTDIDGNCTFCNHAGLKMLGYKEEQDILGKNMHSVLHGTESITNCDLCKATASGRSVAHEGMIYTQQGIAFLAESKSYPQYSNNILVGAVVTFIDITEKKKTNDLIWKQANYDLLTNLPNRIFLHTKIDQEIINANKINSKFALLFIDLDKFKDVNDRLGHHMGDLLLQQVSQRLTSCVGVNDTVARLGGDEFTIIIQDATRRDLVETICKDILVKLNTEFTIGENKVFISASIGITVYPTDGENSLHLLKNADQAMYMTKAGGRNNFHYFNQEITDKLQKRLEISEQLHTALAQNEFQLYFQPVVDNYTGQICKAEVLLRWIHPIKGFISPADFIPVAEEFGLINSIGDWVFKEATKTVKRWQVEGKVTEEFKVCVNVSPLQFLILNLVDDWTAYLKEIQLNPSCVIIEITEGLLLDNNDSISDKIHGFRDNGMEIAIDDFGTGYSAMSYLYKYDIDYLKIDRSFIKNMTLESRHKSITKALIAMAHGLGIRVIAEGIEENAQLDALVEYHCDFSQGFLLYRPMPIEKMEVELLKIENLKEEPKLLDLVD